MRAGKLGRHCVDIQQPVEGTPDAAGEIPITWSTYAGSVPVEILPQGGREFVQAAQVQAEMTHLLKIRYLSGVASSMRALFGTRELHILDVLNVGELNRDMLLSCKEDV